jgi:hypothetical protein
MKRCLFAAIVLVGCGILGEVALGVDDDDPTPKLFDKTYDITVAEFEDHVIETDNFIINNVMLTRVRNEYGEDKKMEQLSFAASIKGRSAKGQEVSVMLAGSDEKKSLLWTLKAADSTYGKSVGSMRDQTRVPLGTLKRTASVWMRVIVVTNSN